MSLPKRDGVQGRYYLIQKPDTNPEVLEHADQCIQDVLDGTAKENHSGYPVVVRNQSGTPFLPSQLLERYLSKLPLKGFPYEEAVTFCDALRRLVGWREIGHTLGKYIKHQVQERFFEIGENEDYFSPFPLCTAWPELRPEDVDEGLLRFACYVAVCYTVYGASYDSLTTEHILGLVSQLRPDMVKQLKTGGSGKLPKDIQRRKTEHFTASANDVFATIRITARDSTEECYAEILDYLCAVLEQEGFPRSYSVEFRGKEKLYLPIPGLPKKGVNQLFACAVQHPNLHPAMARYARLAMSARGMPISVTELVRWTGLSRGFFYKNMQVRQRLEEAVKLPRRIDVQQPSEETNVVGYNFQELKKDFNSCQSENQRLKVENEQLLQKCSILQKEVDTLKKRLDRKEIALLKKL